MKNAKDLLNKNFDELVSTLQNVVRFNTEKGVAAHGAPFGVSVKACLDYVLGVAKHGLCHLQLRRLRRTRRL